MTMSVRFCLSYDPLNWALTPVLNYFSRKKRIVDTDVAKMTLRVCAKVLLHVWSYGFYDMTLSTQLQQGHII